MGSTEQELVGFELSVLTRLQELVPVKISKTCTLNDIGAQQTTSCGPLHTANHFSRNRIRNQLRNGDSLDW